MSNVASDRMRSLLPAPCPVAVVRQQRTEDALVVADTLRGAGLRAVEITLSVPDATDVIRRLRTDAEAADVVGAGTVLTPDEVDACVDAGAQFVVSPVVDRSVVAAAQRLDVPILAGALTPNEVAHARELGLSTLKLFPAHTVGPTHLRALLSVFPGLAFVPTGGVGPENAAAWIAAGAVAVGIGGVLDTTYEKHGRGGLRQLAAELVRVCDDAGRDGFDRKERGV